MPQALRTNALSWLLALGLAALVVSPVRADPTWGRPQPLSSSRAVNTTSPLAGGGALTSDLTLTCTTCVTATATFGTDNVLVRSDGTGRGTQSTGIAVDDSNLMGFGTAVPTHTLTLASTSTGAAAYNTADQVTNYERALTGWVSNVYTINVENGGSGSDRGFQVLTDGGVRGFSLDAAASTMRLLGATNNQAVLRTATSNTGLRLQGLVTTLVTSPVLQIDSTNQLSAPSGTQTVLSVLATMNQTGTAGYEGIEVDITETGTGSGQKDLYTGKTGGTARWRIDNAGAPDVDSTVTAGGTVGAQTVNKPAGTVNFAAAATTLVVTNSLVSANSILAVHARTNDATCHVKDYEPAAGSFTIRMTAACTGETSVGFAILDKN